MKKGANSEKALNKNALSEALITEEGKISARGRLIFKLVRNPTKMKENLGAPSGRLLLLGGRANNKRYVPLIFRNVPLIF